MLAIGRASRRAAAGAARLWRPAAGRSLSSATEVPEQGGGSSGQLRRLPKLAPSEELLGTARKRLFALDEAVAEQQKMESRLRRGNARGSWGLPQVSARDERRRSVKADDHA